MIEEWEQGKVLVVDDEPDVCFLFERILRKRHIRASFAHNLAEANSSMQRDPPALIFLDNNLPDGQGVDFIPFLKENYPQTRIVMVTANDTLGDQKKAFLKGADDFLGKPLSMAGINYSLDRMNETKRQA
jgi:two-component system, OmpR family, response regulator